MPVGIVWATGGVLVATMVPQRGLADASAATVTPGGIVFALALGVAVTVLVGRLVDLPDPPSTSAPAPADATRADLPSGTTALWRGTTPTGRGMLLVGGGAVVVAAVVAGGRQVAGPQAGWPRLAVPLDTVAGAATTTVRPLEFGGWGLRMQPTTGTTAVVTRTGPARRLDRTDGTAVVVSLNSADEAAAVVNALLDRRADAPAGRASVPAPTPPPTSGRTDVAGDRPVRRHAAVPPTRGIGAAGDRARGARTRASHSPRLARRPVRWGSTPRRSSGPTGCWPTTAWWCRGSVGARASATTSIVRLDLDDAIADLVARADHLSWSRDDLARRVRDG